MEVGARMVDPGQRRVPRPTRIRRRPDPVRTRPLATRLRASLLGASLLATFLVGLPGAAVPVAAADADPVLGPWVDALVVGRARVPPGGAATDAGPRILAVASPDTHEPGTIHVVLLERGTDVWSVTGRLDVPTGLAVAGAGELVPIDGAVALVSTDGDAGHTSVTRLVVGDAGVSEGAQTVLALGAGGVGSVDIEGDGVGELALTGDVRLQPPSDCRRTLLEVLDARTLQPRTGPLPIEATPSTAAIGRFDGAGQSIVAGATPSCDSNAGGSWVAGIVRIDPATGATRLVRDLSNDIGLSTGIGPTRPLPVDVDADGRDEVVIRTGDGTSILEPDRGWRSTTLEDGAIPIALASATTGPPVLALYRTGVQGGGGQPPTMELRVLRRDGREIGLGVRAVSVAVGLGPDRLAPPPAISLATDPVAPPPVWSGDLAGSGCTAITVPEVTFQGCGAASGWTERTGPAWLSTVPLDSYGPSRGRRLLVAAGLGWGASSGALASPSPAASALARAAGWRPGPSSPFALEELDASDVAYFTSFPAAAIDIDPNGGGRETPQLVLGGTAGDRIFARLLVAAAPTAGDPVSGPEYVDDPAGIVTSGFLAARPVDVASLTGVIPVPPASTAGAHPGSIALALPLGPRDAASGSMAAAWRVSAIGLNAYGQPSPIVSTTVAVDTIGPDLAIDPPFLSPPWPLSATLRGVAESGARVGIDGGPLADAALNGVFEVRAQLAPWPQQVTIRAVDEHGNVTTTRLDVVGGLDYRRLPWQSILVAVTLLGAAMTTWRGPAALRRTRGPSGSLSATPRSRPVSRSDDATGQASPVGGRDRARSPVAYPTGEPVAEIEDLP